MCSWVITPAAALVLRWSTRGGDESPGCWFIQWQRLVFFAQKPLGRFASACCDVSDMIQKIRLHLNDLVFFVFVFFLFLISYLYLHSRSPCPSPSWPPCEQVPHLSFGCCADGSLLVVYNRPKVSVPHAISTLKLPHYSCPILILFLVFFFFFCKTIPQHASGQRMLSRWYGGFILGGSSKKPQIKHRGR